MTSGAVLIGQKAIPRQLPEPASSTDHQLAYNALTVLIGAISSWVHPEKVAADSWDIIENPQGEVLIIFVYPNPQELPEPPKKEYLLNPNITDRLGQKPELYNLWEMVLTDLYNRVKEREALALAFSRQKQQILKENASAIN